MVIVSGCAILSELTALTKCEFSFHSVSNPRVCGIPVSGKKAWSDFSLMDGQVIATNLLNKTLPFQIVANVEARNPGTAAAAVQSILWIAYIDDIQVAQGQVSERVEVPPSGGKAMIPVRISSDLFKFLEGDNPRTMINFALNLADAGNQPTRLSMKIKPSVLVAGQTINYPGYFTIAKEFSSGSQAGSN